MKLYWLAVVFLVVVPAVAADTLTEDFESYDLTGFITAVDPDLSWYTYREGSEDIGAVTTEAALAGAQGFGAASQDDVSPGDTFAQFTLTRPTTVDSIEFKVKGTTISDDGSGSSQVIALRSSAPHRDLVEFYVQCRDTSNPGGCSLSVRWRNVDTTGIVLINTSAAQSEFNIEVVPDWFNNQFQLFVDSVDDGTFPFYETPKDFGRLSVRGNVASIPMGVQLDDWVILGGIDDVAAAEDGDVATGLKNWAAGVKFTSAGSLFVLGLVVLIILAAAVMVPLILLGKDNTLTGAMGFYVVLVVLWLVTMEWFPEWIGIALIILVAALLSLLLRRAIMGIRDTGGGNPALVAGALGYFIIATTFLGFSGYATETVELPTSVLTTEEDEAINETTETQSYGWAVVECLVTLFGDCTTKTVSETWAKITDIASTIFNFARSAFRFLFQLLTFQLPIPAVFNIMIVLPPGAALASVGLSFITRSGS